MYALNRGQAPHHWNFRIAVSLLVVAVMLVTLLRACPNPSVFGFLHDEIIAAQAEFVSTRSPVDFDDPNFLSIGIKPDWSPDQVVSHMQSLGFVLVDRQEATVAGRLSCTFNKYYGIFGPHHSQNMFIREISAPSESLQVIFANNQPWLGTYYYKDNVTKSKQMIARLVNYQTWKASPLNASREVIEATMSSSPAR